MEMERSCEGYSGTKKKYIYIILAWSSGKGNGEI